MKLVMARILIEAPPTVAGSLAELLDDTLRTANRPRSDQLMAYTAIRIPGDHPIIELTMFGPAPAKEFAREVVRIFGPPQSPRHLWISNWHWAATSAVGYPLTLDIHALGTYSSMDWRRSVG